MNLARKQDVVAILWDNKESTIEQINKEICSVVISFGYDGSVGRCYNEKTDKNDMNDLFFSIKEGPYTTNNFFSVGDYLVMDLTNKLNPVFSMSEKRLFEVYKKI